MKNAGIILVIIGILMMIYTGFTVITKEKVIDLGPLEVKKEKREPVQWSPIVGGIILVGGVVILLTGKKKVV